MFFFGVLRDGDGKMEKRKYPVDVHTHTIASGHAYCTWLENIREAADKGMELLGITDHGPAMPGATPLIYFNNLKAIPRNVYGVTILKGCEANILGGNGRIDLPAKTKERLDIIIASMHDICMKSLSVDNNTNALLDVMEDPYIDIIGHPGNPYFPINEEKVVRKAAEKNIIIEINNSSFTSRLGSEDNCIKIAKLCKQYNTKVIMGSDSHVCFTIGEFAKAQSVLEMVGMPEELIMNSDKYKLIHHLKNKGKLKDV